MINNLNNIIQISAGYDYSLTLTSDGQIYSFGINNYGQLGLGDDENKNIPMLISKLDNIISVSAGIFASLALTNNGQVYAFGDNHYGQLGLEITGDIDIPKLIFKLIDQNLNIIEISAGFNQSLVVTDNDDVFGFGSEKYYSNRDPKFIMSI